MDFMAGLSLETRLSVLLSNLLWWLSTLCRTRQSTWAHDCLLQQPSQPRLKMSCLRIIQLSFVPLVSLRINQARVYLQAYRVGYKIQCPDRKSRWVRPEKRCWWWDHIPRQPTLNWKTATRYWFFDESLFHFCCHLLKVQCHFGPPQKCAPPLFVHGSWQWSNLEVIVFLNCFLVLLFLYIIHGCQESEVTLHFELNHFKPCEGRCLTTATHTDTIKYNQTRLAFWKTLEGHCLSFSQWSHLCERCFITDELLQATPPTHRHTRHPSVYQCVI